MWRTRQSQHSWRLKEPINICVAPRCFRCRQKNELKNERLAKFGVQFKNQGSFILKEQLLPISCRESWRQNKRHYLIILLHSNGTTVTHCHRTLFLLCYRAKLTDKNWNTKSVANWPDDFTSQRTIISKQLNQISLLESWRNFRNSSAVTNVYSYNTMIHVI